MLGLPIKLFDPETIEPYSEGETLSCHSKGDKVILTFQSEDEDGEWAGGEGWLASLLPIRADLLSGDYRALYLGWLGDVQSEEIDDDELEPPVPGGLKTLNASLDRLADFLRLSRDLIAAAAEASPGEQAIGLSQEEFGKWVLSLPSQEKDRLLLRLVEGDNPHCLAELRQQARRELRGDIKPVEGPRRTAGQIRARAEILAAERKRIEAEKKARDLARRKRRRLKNEKSISSLWSTRKVFFGTRWKNSLPPNNRNDMMRQSPSCGI